MSKHFPKFEHIFSQIPSGERIHIDDFCSKFSVSETTVKKHLRKYIQIHKGYLNKLLGFYPDQLTIIDLALEEMGTNKPHNKLWELNLACKKIVDGLTFPIHEEFLEELFSDKFNGKNISASKKVLINRIYHVYGEFLRESGNSITSVVGRLNEEILMNGLESVGLIRDQDFQRTGQNSEADLLIFNNKKLNQKKLYVEIKSYHARERFLRALRDINDQNKIGVGFFIDPSEFNPKRSQLYTDADTMAIYMPDHTYNRLHKGSKKFISRVQSKLYRPLTRFCKDMKAFHQTGILPKF